MGQRLGKSPHTPTSCLAPCRPSAAPATGGPQMRLAPSHPAMLGARVPEPYLLSPALAHSAGRSVKTPPQSPLNTLFLPPTIALLRVSVCRSKGWGCSKGLGQRPWEGGRSNTSWQYDLGQDTQHFFHSSNGATRETTVAGLATSLRGLETREEKNQLCQGCQPRARARPRPAASLPGCRGRPLPGIRQAQPGPTRCTGASWVG